MTRKRTTPKKQNSKATPSDFKTHGRTIAVKNDGGTKQPDWLSSVKNWDKQHDDAIAALGPSTPETTASVDARVAKIDAKSAKFLRRAAKVNKSPSPLTPDLLSETKGKKTMPKPAAITTPRRRNRSGYMQPNRTDKVGMHAFVDETTREKFKNVAAEMGVPAHDLLRHLIEHTIERGTNPQIKAAIADEKHRADEARKNIFAAITPGKVSLG
jgi:antitoxin component of RelBE/YafQ-DinJ toxin-antitoxin module